VTEAVSFVPWCTRGAGALVEFPEHTDVTELIGVGAAPGSGLTLREVVCVVDAAHLIADLHRTDYVIHPASHPAHWRHTARALLTVMGIEFASTVVLVNWEPLNTPELSSVMGLVNHLSPRVRLRLHHGTRTRGCTRHPPPTPGTTSPRSARGGSPCSTGSTIPGSRIPT